MPHWNKEMGLWSHHRDEGQRTAAGTGGSFKSADRQGRFCDRIGKAEGRTLLCEFRG